VRDLKEVLKKYHQAEKFVDVTITSPPYFDLKSYGYGNQIGHGQGYYQYLDDLEEIFRQTYLVTKDTGSLWIVVDTFCKNGNFVNLPFEIAERLENLFEERLEDNKTKKFGWKLTDLIIWKKDKTLPWSKKGQFRNIFEYILFFTKSKEFKFYIDRIRVFDFSKLKEWWVNFPERYSPKGAVLTNVWEYPIPTQGIWTEKSLRHFNPLPPKMIESILLLTTDTDDVIFDPFSGSGTVLSVADFWKRKWFGFEKNPMYCKLFARVMEEIKQELSIEKNRKRELEILREEFEQTIKNLRLVKYPKILMRELNRTGALSSANQLISTVFALSTETQEDEHNLSNFPKNKFMGEDVFLILSNQVETDFLRKQINTTVAKSPLSKFGIESRVFLESRDEFASQKKNVLKNVNLWLYSFGVVRKFERPITFSDWISESMKTTWRNYTKNAIPPIISNVNVNREVPKSWQSKEKKHSVLIDTYRELVP
jgi:DNA modification methylase